MFDELAALRGARAATSSARCGSSPASSSRSLNLDAAVVLLTPLYMRTALLVDVDPVALAFQPVLLASLASSVLVVSNLTNLLAASQLVAAEHRLPPPSRVTVARRIGGRLVRVPPCVPHPGRTRRVASAPLDRRALVVGLGAIALFLVLLLGGEPFGVPAWAAAARDRGRADRASRRLPWRHVPVGTVGARGRARGARGRRRGRAPARRSPASATAASAGFAAGVVSANLLNNLPAVLVGLAHVSTRGRVWPLLLGVNLGPLLLLTGSLAGLALAGGRPPGRGGDRRPPLQPGRGRGRAARDGRGRARAAGPGMTGTRHSYPDRFATEWRENGAVYAAAVRFDLHVPQSRSLKAKRAAIRPIVDGLRHRFRVSVAEVDHQDQWQRAAIAVAVVGEQRRRRSARCSTSVERFVVAARRRRAARRRDRVARERAGVSA